MIKTGCLSFILAVMLALTCLLSASCGTGVTYRNDVAVSELCTAADALLPNSADFATMSDDYIIGMMGIDPSNFAEHAVKLRASGANIDEYGIFKAKSEADTASVKQTVEAYLRMRLDSWMPEYMPEEFPKMEAASIKVMGQYVIYCILDENTKADVFTEIESTLS